MSQGKYVLEILKRFGMMDCKSMTMLMTMNLRLFGDTTSEQLMPPLQVDDWFVDVFDEHEARYILCNEHFESVYG